MRISDWSSDVCSSDLFIVHRQATGQLLLNKARDLRRTSKDHGCSFRRPHQSCTDRSIARQELQDIWPDASLMQNAYPLVGDQGRFFGRFVQHAVANDRQWCNWIDEEP